MAHEHRRAEWKPEGHDKRDNAVCPVASERLKAADVVILAGAIRDRYLSSRWKLFFDRVWSNLRMVFQADHRHYRSHGLYDFPRRSLKTQVVQGSMMLLTRIPSFRREFRRRLKNGMVRPFQKVLEDF